MGDHFLSHNKLKRNMSNQLYLLIGLIIALFIYFKCYTSSTLEQFEQAQCNPNNSIVSKSVQDQFGDGLNISCLINTRNNDCKLIDNIFPKSKLYPLHIIRTTGGGFLSVFNDGKLYLNDNIEQENLWRGPLVNSEPKKNVHLLMVTYDRTGILIGVGSDHLLYVKTKDDFESPWNMTPIPNSGCVTYVMFDKDHRLLGIGLDGFIVKKKTDNITSNWEAPKEEYRIPMLKIYWDINGHMMGIGSNYKLYQKALPTWEASKWKVQTTVEQLADVIYDADGRLYGIVLDKVNDMIELRKQNQAYYTSQFYPLDDNEVEGVNIMNLAQLIQSKMGSEFQTDLDKSRGDDELIDPSLDEVQQQYILDNQSKLRNLCANKKKIYNSTDYYDFDLQRKIEEQDSLLKNLNEELNKYSKLDKKYLKIQEVESIKDINEFAK